MPLEYHHHHHHHHHYPPPPPPPSPRPGRRGRRRLNNDRDLLVTFVSGNICSIVRWLDALILGTFLFFFA